MVTITASERETTYNPITPQNDFAVVFPIFGVNVGEFPASDLEVEVNGTLRTDFTVIANFSEGVSTDAKVRFTPGITGSVIVRGNRTARRTDEYKNGAPLRIPDHNYSLNRVTAELQEVKRDSRKTSNGLKQERLERIDADDAERIARIAGDQNLSGLIDAERIARINADTIEAAQRIAGDAASTSLVQAEAATRMAEDNAIRAQIDGIIPTVTALTSRAEGAAITSENAAEAAQSLVEAAVSGFQGFVDGMGYDFGFITEQLTYFNRDFGSIADPVTN